MLAGIHRRGRGHRGCASRPGALACWVVTKVAAQNPGAQNDRTSRRARSAPTKSDLYKDVTTYNNFYEFSSIRSIPAKYSRTLLPRPWTVVVEGLVRKAAYVQHRRYHEVSAARRAHLPASLRRGVVDRGSVGRLPLSELIKRFEPTRKAKYVEFMTVYDLSQMPGQHRQVLQVAVRRRPAHGRGDASADAALPRPVRGRPSEPGWRAAADCVAVEVRIQERQVDRRVRSPRKNRSTAGSFAARVRLLRQRESEGRSSALDAGQRTPPRRVLPPPTLPFNGYGDQVASL